MFMNFPAAAKDVFYRKKGRNFKFIEFPRLSYFKYIMEHLEYS